MRDAVRRSKNRVLNFRMGSKPDEIQCPRHVGFSPHSDQIAEIAGVGDVLLGDIAAIR
jgi:hypothetical protein